MLDIHCHIIPGVDDGSGDMNDSIEMAAIAAASGTKSIIATPHCNIPGLFANYKSPLLLSRVDELNTALKENGIDVRILTGQEIFVSRSFVQRFESNSFMTLNNSRYMLVEYDFRTTPEFVVSSIGYIVSKGYVPIIAHPERYSFVIEEPQVVQRLKDAGALIQINGGSLTADFGEYVMRTAEYLTEKRLADFAASDAHSQYSRTPDLSRVHELICENYSYDYAELLLRTNPARVIADRII